MARFLIFLIFCFSVSLPGQAVLFSVSPEIENGEEFTLDVMAFIRIEDKAYVIENCYLNYHNETLAPNGNSAVFATLKAGDVHRVNFAVYSEFMRRNVPDNQVIQFIVAIKKGHNIIYSEFFSECDEDSDDYLVDLLLDQNGKYQVHSGEIVIESEGDDTGSE